eukprot:UN02333
MQRLKNERSILKRKQLDSSHPVLQLAKRIKSV